MVKKMKWKVKCQAKVRNVMFCATQCPTTLLFFYEIFDIFIVRNNIESLRNTP